MTAPPRPPALSGQLYENSTAEVWLASHGLADWTEWHALDDAFKAHQIAVRSTPFDPLVLEHLSVMVRSKRWVGHTEKKVPVSLGTWNRKCKTDPKLWSDFATVEAYRRRTEIPPSNFAGFGFCLAARTDTSPDDPLICVDADDYKHGAEETPASKLVNVAMSSLDTYQEYSPSGNGRHAYCLVSDPVLTRYIGGQRKAPGLDVIGPKGFFTVTFKPLPGHNRPIKDCTEQLWRIVFSMKGLTRDDVIEQHRVADEPKTERARQVAVAQSNQSVSTPLLVMTEGGMTTDQLDSAVLARLQSVEARRVYTKSMRSAEGLGDRPTTPYLGTFMAAMRYPNNFGVALDIMRYNGKRDHSNSDRLFFFHAVVYTQDVDVLFELFQASSLDRSHDLARQYDIDVRNPKRPDAYTYLNDYVRVKPMEEALQPKLAKIAASRINDINFQLSKPMPIGELITRMQRTGFTGDDVLALICQLIKANQLRFADGFVSRLSHHQESVCRVAFPRRSNTAASV